jgi:hypothetical protein
LFTKLAAAANVASAVIGSNGRRMSAVESPTHIHPSQGSTNTPKASPTPTATSNAGMRRSVRSERRSAVIDMSAPGSGGGLLE